MNVKSRNRIVLLMDVIVCREKCLANVFEAIATKISCKGKFKQTVQKPNLYIYELTGNFKMNDRQ